jgi:hypothetical protein
MIPDYEQICAGSTAAHCLSVNRDMAFWISVLSAHPCVALRAMQDVVSGSGLRSLKSEEGSPASLEKSINKVKLLMHNPDFGELSRAA